MDITILPVDLFMLESSFNFTRSWPGEPGNKDRSHESFHHSFL
jgi:hypothetical protein